MKQVHILFEHDINGQPHGCSEIRLLRPMQYLQADAGIEVTQGVELPEGDVDIVIVERLWSHSTDMRAAERLVRAVRGKGASLIYTLDDNLVDLNIDEPWQGSLTEEQRMVVRYFLREADGVIVSTEPLKERFSKLCRAIVVVPNALDERLFQSSIDPAEPSVAQSDLEERLTIGYMGTLSHSEDLMMILEPLKRFLSEYQGNIVFQIAGVTADRRVIDCFKGYPFEIMNVGEDYAYARFIKWAKANIRWDFALAPLVDCPLNRYKSDIKFLDYGFLRVPAIYSDAPAYCASVTHMQTGLICDEDAESWYGAMELMAEDVNIRREISESAFRYVDSERSLAVCAREWIGAVQDLSA